MQDLWTQILGHVGFLPLADWAVHFLALVWYRALHATLSPALSSASQQLPARQRYNTLIPGNTLLLALRLMVQHTVRNVSTCRRSQPGLSWLPLCCLLHGVPRALS